MYLGQLQTCPALILALLAQANNPRRLAQANDDAVMGSCAYPYATLLGGIPGRIPSDHLLSPLCGLRVSRYRRGDAFTSTPEGQELHLHEDTVIKDRSIDAPSPPEPLRDSGFRETDRTCKALLGGRLLLPLHPWAAYSKAPSVGAILFTIVAASIIASATFGYLASSW